MIRDVLIVEIRWEKIDISGLDMQRDESEVVKVIYEMRMSIQRGR